MGSRQKYFHTIHGTAATRGINRAGLFLDHDRPSHLRVNRAKILVSAGSSHRDGELLIGVEGSRFLKLLPNAHDRVGFFVPVNPGHLLSRLHGYGLRIESEIFDLYSVLLVAGAGVVLHLARDREKG